MRDELTQDQVTLSDRQLSLYVVDVPAGDRPFIWRHLSPEQYDDFKKTYPGCAIYRITAFLPELGRTFDMELYATTTSVRREDL